MKALYAGLFVASLVFVSGSNTSSSGGSVEAGTFKLSGPENWKDKTIERKKPETVKITVKPDDKFKEPITFTTKVDPADKGVKASVEPATWKPSDNKDVELHIEAGDDAAQGEYTIHVIGKPAKGKESDLQVKIKVPDKK